jgi:hypothetical protein
MGVRWMRGAILAWASVMAFQSGGWYARGSAWDVGVTGLVYGNWRVCAERFVERHLAGGRRRVGPLGWVLMDLVLVTVALPLLSLFSLLQEAREVSVTLRVKVVKMDSSERRHLTRFPIRTPLRFRALGVAADKTDHFTLALNISRGGFYFATTAPLQVGMPIEATLQMPGEVTGSKPEETHCTARVVHARSEAFGDGRIGFGAEIETFLAPDKSKP